MTTIFKYWIFRWQYYRHNYLKGIQDKKSVAYFYLTNFSLLLVADFQANPFIMQPKYEAERFSCRVSFAYLANACLVLCKVLDLF